MEGGSYTAWYYSITVRPATTFFRYDTVIMTAPPSLSLWMPRLVAGRPGSMEHAKVVNGDEEVQSAGMYKW